MKLEAEEFQQQNKSLDVEQNNINIKIIVTHSHVERLILKSYQPSTDNELLYIMNNFTQLKHFELTAMTGYAWPISTISQSVMLSFMEFMQRCDHYCMTIGGSSGEIWIVDLFYQTLQDTTLDFYIYPEKRYSYGSRGKFELALSQREGNASLSVSYGLSGKVNELDSRVKPQLTNLPPNTENLSINFGERGWTFHRRVSRYCLKQATRSFPKSQYI